MNGIVWLASYPKSGNTWFRVFLANLLRNAEAPASINNLGGAPIASNRGLFDDSVGFEGSDLTADEIDRLRPELYVHLAKNTEEPLFMKIHDAYTYVGDNMPLVPTEATFGALYFIRNPLDVAVSFAYHSGCDLDTSISRMADGTFAFARKTDRLPSQIRQKLLSWSGHVLSWVDRAPFPVGLLRYEDMKFHPLPTFTKAVQFAGLSHGCEQIRKALTFSSFSILQQQEAQEGFCEKGATPSLFFRKGQVGSWRHELSDEQVKQIIRDHREVMLRFGYLDENGKIIC